MYQHRYSSKNNKEQNCVDWTERLKKHLQLLCVFAHDEDTGR